ncbi:MAG: L-glutamate gamma-semialdehyde dehydrogenase, partial [Armatimonadetes bacterium]|nr:L-glutamate gamma-semialdehyde dehydrogenase [Armatimonadota bacterium]
MLLTLTEFKNEVLTNFIKKENLEKMEQALELVYSQMYKEYPLIIGEKIIKTKDKFKSLNPSNPSEIIGVFQASTIKETEAAIFSAEKSFQVWSKVPV